MNSSFIKGSSRISHFASLCILSVLSSLLFSQAAWPETFELTDGRTIQGDVIEKNNHEYQVQTMQGVLSLPFELIKSIKGQAAPVKNIQAPERTTAQTPAPALPKIEINAAVVGGVPISRQEFEAFLTVAAHQAKRSLKEMSAESRKLLLEHAIEMEMLVHAAISEKLLEEPPLRDRLIGFYLQDKIGYRGELKDVSEEELKNFFAAYPEAFSGKNKRSAKYEETPKAQIFDVMKSEEQKMRYGALLAELKASFGDAAPEVLLFRGALQEGYSRLVPIRQQLISNYLQKHQKSWNAALEPLLPVTPVEILVQDFAALQENESANSLSQPEWSRDWIKYDPQTGRLINDPQQPSAWEENWWPQVWTADQIEFLPVRGKV